MILLMAPSVEATTYVSEQLNLSHQNYSGDIQAEGNSTVTLDASEVAGNVTLADSTLTTSNQSQIDGNLVANQSTVTLGSGTSIRGRTTISSNSDVTIDGSFLTFEVNSTDSQLTLKNHTGIIHSLTVTGGSLSMDNSYVIDGLGLSQTSATLSKSQLYRGLYADYSTVYLSNASSIDLGANLYNTELTLDAGTRLSGGAAVSTGSHLIADGATLSGDIQTDRNSTVSLNAVNSTGAVTLDNGSQLLASNQTTVSGNIDANNNSSVILNDSETHANISLRDSALVAENDTVIHGDVIARSSEANLAHSAIDGALSLINSQANLMSTSSVSGLVSVDQASSLHVSNTRLLGGVANNGRLTLGTSTSLATPSTTFDSLMVSGNYTQSATGILGINLYDASLYSRLNASGDVNLAGVLDINVSNGSPISLRDQIASVIHADGTLSGMFSQITDNSALFNFKASYGNKDVSLQVVTASQTGISDAVSPQINPSLTSSANVLDHIISQDTTGQIATAFTPLVTNQDISNAVLQTLPMSMLGGMPAIQTSFSGISDTVTNHLSSFGVTGQSSGDALTADQYLWVKPFASWTNQSDQDGVNGFTSKTGGFVFGMDGQMNENTRLGAAFAYANVDLNSHASSSQTAKINVYQLVGYGSHTFDNQTKLNFQADIGFNQTEGSRHISFAGVVAKAKYNSTSAHLGASLAKSFQWSDDVLITPSVGADYTWVRDHAHSETGAGAFNLNVASKSTNQFLMGAKGKLAYQLNPSTQLTMDAGLSYDLNPQQSMITAAYAGSPDASFVTYGQKPSRWLASLGLGLTHRTNNGMEITGRYDGTFRKGYQNHSASVTFRWQY